MTVLKADFSKMQRSRLRENENLSSWPGLLAQGMHSGRQGSTTQTRTSLSQGRAAAEAPPHGVRGPR